MKEFSNTLCCAAKCFLKSEKQVKKFTAKSIFTEFGLKSGDNPITTDCGANIICALNSETRFQCMAHRLNTVLTDAVKVVESDDESFLLFNQAVRDLIAYVHRSDLSQDKLPVTLKKYSGNRPWRSFFFVHNALVKYYEVLGEMLEQRNETHRIVKISL